MGRKLGQIVFFLVFLLPCCTHVHGATQPLVISCGAVGKEFELCRSAAQTWSKSKGIPVEVLTAPSASGDRLAQYQLLLASGSPDIDVLVVDTTWPGMMGDFLVDLAPHVPRTVLEKHFPAFIANNTVHGRLTALPWFIDAGLLYYRKDLLKKYRRPVPATWQELTETALIIQNGERSAGNSRFWGYLFQGRAYEGLTCNALEWIASFGGGTLINSEGKISVDSPGARQALEQASTWVGKISPPGVLNAMEEESRAVFQSGDAAFLRNWPYVWKLANAQDSPVRGKIGFAPLPSGRPGGPRAATLGGWSLGVSKHSKNIPAAVALALALSGPEEQKRRALQAGLYPTLPELYKEPDLLRENAALGELLEVFRHAMPRPSQVTGTKYNAVSSEIWNSVHEVMSHKRSVDDSLERLIKALKRISRNERWT